MEIPQNHSALYDLMQQRFGIGDYDEADSTLPYWKARGIEIARLKAQMRRRRLTIEDLTKAVWYAEREKQPITAVWQLCGLVGLAKRAWREHLAIPQTDQRDALNRAASLAWERGDHGWAYRLNACDLPSAAVVLEQWYEHLERAR